MADPDLCVTRVPIFQGLTAEQQEHVAALAHPMRVGGGEIIVVPGRRTSRLFVLHSGALKVSRIAEDGRERVLRTVAVGDVVGERAFLTEHRSYDTIVALEDSSMCMFDHADLLGLLRRYPGIGLRMLRELSDRLASTERMLTAVTSQDVQARVAAYLLDLPARMRDGALVVRLPMAKQDVASHLGTTPETLSRRLAAMASAGMIALHGGYEVAILDAEALENAATPSRDLPHQR